MEIRYMVVLPSGPIRTSDRGVRKCNRRQQKLMMVNEIALFLKRLATRARRRAGGAERSLSVYNSRLYRSE